MLTIYFKLLNVFVFVIIIMKVVFYIIESKRKQFYCDANQKIILLRILLSGSQDHSPLIGQSYH